jgi:hypothetical protein
MAEKASIECNVVKVLMTQDMGRGINQIRIVRWIVDGKDTGALLEKRNFFKSKEGDEKMGKAKGFNRSDVSYIVENWKEIQTLL